MIRRPPRSTLSSSSAASDVYKRQVLLHVKQVLADEKIELVKSGHRALSMGYPFEQTRRIRTSSCFVRFQHVIAIFRSEIVCMKLIKQTDNSLVLCRGAAFDIRIETVGPQLFGNNCCENMGREHGFLRKGNKKIPGRRYINAVS